MTEALDITPDRLPALARIKAGNAPCSWGIMGGFELDPMPTYGQVLDEIAASGFAGTELGDWGFMPDDPGVLGGGLESRGLAMIGAFTPVRLSDRGAHTESEAIALRTARLLHAVASAADGYAGPIVILAEAATLERQAVAGRVTREHGLSGEEWRALSDGANRIAKVVRDETGLRTVFHHHAGTPVETLDETRRFLEMTDPDLVGLCFDTGHFAYAGADPLEAYRSFRDRVWHVHFKDYMPDVADNARRDQCDYHQAVAGGLFCELGRGSVDFPALLDELLVDGYEGWVVVEDEMPPGSFVPVESARRDRSYLRGLGL